MDRRNSFTFLRLIAALPVVLFHCLSFVAASEENDPLYQMTFGQMHLGGLGVAMFFIISGYVIAGSWQRRPQWLTFMWRRIIRIYPALIVVTLLTIVVLGPLTTTAHDY